MANSDDSPATRAAWDWEGISDDELSERWRELASWVEWLQTAYEDWVELPPCWPLHDWLCNELLLFSHWHAMLFEPSTHPSEGVEWHQQIRASAEAWRRISTCEHVEPMPHQRALQEHKLGRTAKFLESAIS